MAKDEKIAALNRMKEEALRVAAADRALAATRLQKSKEDVPESVSAWRAGGAQSSAALAARHEQDAEILQECIELMQGGA